MIARRWWMGLVGVAALVAGGMVGRAQIIANPTVSGVSIDADGMVRQRVLMAENDPAAKARLAALRPEAKEPGLAYISLPRVLGQVRAAVEAGKPIPEDLRYLGGLTQLRYIFVYPEEHDLVLAGPAEAWDAANPLEPVGKTSGRPVLQLDDLVVALRTVAQPAGRAFFGCSIDPPADALERSDAVARKFGSLPRQQLIAKMVEAMGPQKVSVLNTADDTRLAFIMVAADYKLKRISMGLESIPGAGIPAAFDGTRSSACRFWFAPAYEPLLVSEDGNSYGLRGPRLKLVCGAQSFDPRGATVTAQRFATKVNEKFALVAATVGAVADLQNIADLTLLAALIRNDKLEERAGFDLTWARASFPVGRVAVPKTAETAVAVTTGAITSGGVAISMGPVVDAEARQKEAGGAGGLAETRKRPEAEAWKVLATTAK